MPSIEVDQDGSEIHFDEVRTSLNTEPSKTAGSPK